MGKLVKTVLSHLKFIEVLIRDMMFMKLRKILNRSKLDGKDLRNW